MLTPRLSLLIIYIAVETISRNTGYGRTAYLLKPQWVFALPIAS